MKNLREIPDHYFLHMEQLKEKYRRLYTDPEQCEPLILVQVPYESAYPWEARLENPEAMLLGELERLAQRIELEDDHLFCARVNFGTAQQAAAFGCEIFIPPNNLPAAKTHVLEHLDDVLTMKKPTLIDGLMPKIDAFTDYYLEHLPHGLAMQHPDVQSAFNTAHLIRGNDIFLDFYDDPDKVELLMDLVTEYMLDYIAHTKARFTTDTEWFHDSGGFWKGGARLSNCTMQLISPMLYEEYVEKQDKKFLRQVGGGRVHYCGNAPAIVDNFLANELVHSLEIDAQFNDLYEVAEKMPTEQVLCLFGGSVDGTPPDWVEQVLAGNLPTKRNLVLQVSAKTVAEGRALYQNLKRAFQP